MPGTKKRNLRFIERRKEGTLNKKGTKKERAKETLSYSRKRRI
jgi:hypothetical protein